MEWMGHRGQKASGVGVRRVPEDAGDGRVFDNLASLHHRHVESAHSAQVLWRQTQNAAPEKVDHPAGDGGGRHGHETKGGTGQH